MEEDNFFNQNKNLQGLHPYARREVEVEVVDGMPRMVEHIYYQGTGPDGALTIFEAPRYLCQGCGVVWIVLGIDGFWWKNTVLCRKCLRRARLKWILTPLWSPFIKFNENK